MNGFLYGVALQWKLDLRSKSLLITCYIVPLIFFLLMGGIFTSLFCQVIFLKKSRNFKLYISDE